jgi:hypothetical protein
VAAPEHPHQVQFVQRLDAFGRRFHAQRFGQADDRGDDCAVATARLGRAAHERLVDLDLVERGRAQVAERRIARAEIVERQAHTDRFQLLEHLIGALVVVEEHALGDFQLKPPRLHPGVGQGRGHDRGQRRVGELQRRDVDRHAHILGPLREVLAGRAQRPLADRGDQAGVLGNRNELVRGDEALLGMVPA